MRILVTASGGGHTGYAIDIARELLRRGHEVLIAVDPMDAASKRMIRARLGSHADLGIVEERCTAATPGKGGRLAPLRVLAQVPRWRRALRKRGRIDVVVATGGNRCFAPSLAARSLGAKLVVLESCVRLATPSNTLKLLGRIADAVALQWEEQLAFAPRGKSVVVGPILPREHPPPIDRELVTVATGTWGYLGAEVATRLAYSACRILGCSKAVVQVKGVWGRERRDGIDIELTSFVDDMLGLFARSKLVVSHFGRSALEARYLGAPVVIVPNEAWWRTSAGALDAIAFARKIGAVLLRFRYIDRRFEDAVRRAIEIPRPELESGAPALADLVEAIA